MHVPGVGEGLREVECLRSTLLNYYIDQMEPFFTRPLFNPFGHLPIAELVVFFGLLTRWACEGTNYVEYWSPVWAGSAVSKISGLKM